MPLSELSNIVHRIFDRFYQADASSTRAYERYGIGLASVQELIANRIYQLSYLSLETALSFYSVIPEGVYALTSVSSRKTQTMHTPVASFIY